MMGYWLRILGAWCLLHFASRIVKDAENLLRETAANKQLPEVPEE